MVSAIDLAQRKLVALLKTLAGVYHVALSLTRESADADDRWREWSVQKTTCMLLGLFFFARGPVRNATSALQEILEKSYKEASSFFMLASPPPEKSVAHPVSTDLLTEIWNNAKIHLIFGCQVPHGSGMIAVNTWD